MSDLPLWHDPSISSRLTPYLLEDGEPHSAILILPGGGYNRVSDHAEGEPVAKTFNKLGFHALVLHYRVAPHRFPEPQLDAFRAMKIVRGNAARWNIIPDQIAVCGFSAGGHLAACLGTLNDEISAVDGDEYDTVDPRPDAMILGYPVITIGELGPQASGDYLFGTLTPELIRRYSLHRRVHDKTPPTFLWHTIADQLVPFRNSCLFADALIERNIPCELHLLPFGEHAMLLGLGTDDLIRWPEDAAAFLKTQWKVRQDPSLLKTRYAYAYQENILRECGLSTVPRC